MGELAELGFYHQLRTVRRDDDSGAIGHEARGVNSFNRKLIVETRHKYQSIEIKATIAIRFGVKM
jgi:hypothetical protein